MHLNWFRSIVCLDFYELVMGKEKTLYRFSVEQQLSILKSSERKDSSNRTSTDAKENRDEKKNVNDAKKYGKETFAAALNGLQNAISISLSVWHFLYFQSSIFIIVR